MSVRTRIGYSAISPLVIALAGVLLTAPRGDTASACTARSTWPATSPVVPRGATKKQRWTRTATRGVCRTQSSNARTAVSHRCLAVFSPHTSDASLAAPQTSPSRGRRSSRRRGARAVRCSLPTRRVSSGPAMAPPPGRNRWGVHGSGGSLEPPEPLLEPPGPIFTHLHTVYMACSERLPTRLNPLAERTCFS